MHRPTAARLGGLAVVALALVACSSNSTSQVTSRSTDSPATPSLSRQEEYRAQLEWNDRLLACFRAEGIETTEIPGGGVELGTEGLSDEAFQALSERCESQAGPPVIPAPLTDEEARQQYGWELETRECLIEEGFTVVEPASEQQFVEDVMAQRPSWSPYDGIEDIPGAQAACPQRTLGEE